MGRTDQHQGLDIFWMLQRIVQGQNSTQRETAQVNRPARLGTVRLKGNTEIGVDGLPPVQNSGQLRAEDFLRVI